MIGYLVIVYPKNKDFKINDILISEIYRDQDEAIKFKTTYDNSTTHFAQILSKFIL